MFSFSVGLPFKPNKISADNLCIHTKHHFPSCALPAALQSERRICTFFLPGYEWVHLFLEDREGRVEGLERRKSDAAHFVASVEREAYRSRIFAAQAQSPTDVFRRWARHQCVGKAEKGIVFKGGAACDCTGALQQGRGA